MAKVAQCRYCTNSSDEGEGVWFKDHKRWICMPCLVEILEIKYLPAVKLRIKRAIIILDKGLRRTHKYQWKDWDSSKVQNLIIEAKQALTED